MITKFVVFFVTLCSASLKQIENDILAIGEMPRATPSNKSSSRGYIKHEFETAGYYFDAVVHPRNQKNMLTYQLQMIKISICHSYRNADCLYQQAKVLVNDYDYTCDYDVVNNLFTSKNYVQTLLQSIKDASQLNDYDAVRAFFTELKQEMTKQVPPAVNLIAYKPSYDDLPVFIVCAHYDSLPGVNGYLDNAAGVAAMLDVAREYSQNTYVNVKFIAFDFEEYETQGSQLYLESLTHSEREKIAGVINFDCIGAFSQQPNSQQLPEPYAQLFPDVFSQIKQDNFRGNFITVVSDAESKNLGADFVKAAKSLNILTEPGQDYEQTWLSTVSYYWNSLTGTYYNPLQTWIAMIASDLSFKKHCDDLVYLCRSDQQSFYQYGIKAVQISDTAELRNPCYHEQCDSHLTEENLIFIQQVADITLKFLQKLELPLK